MTKQLRAAWDAKSRSEVMADRAFDRLFNEAQVASTSSHLASFELPCPFLAFLNRRRAAGNVPISPPCRCIASAATIIVSNKSHCQSNAASGMCRVHAGQGAGCGGGVLGSAAKGVRFSSKCAPHTILSVSHMFSWLTDNTCTHPRDPASPLCFHGHTLSVGVSGCRVVTLSAVGIEGADSSR